MNGQQDSEGGASSLDRKIFDFDQLPAGVTKELLEEAISRSGYPFQAVVADALEAAFTNTFGTSPRIQEEWPYVDSETGNLRAIDVFAESPALINDEREKRKTSPHLSVLVECKQSEMPYIFFLRGRSPSATYDFPSIAGLPAPEIKIIDSTPDRTRRLVCSLSLHDFLAIWDLGFFSSPIMYAVSVSKMARKPSGVRLELTGEEAYRSLTFPLVKAARHLEELSAEGKLGGRLTYRIVICLAVLRSPMYGVIHTEDGVDLVDPIQHARVYYLEPAKLDSTRLILGGKARYYDAVHESYFSDYLNGLLASIKALVDRIEGAADVISAGKGIGEFTENSYETVQRISSPEDDAYLEEMSSLGYRISRHPVQFKLQSKKQKL